MSRARAVVEAIAKALADKPDSVSVTERDARGQSMVELTMAPGDMGRVIGREGRTVKAIRSILFIAGQKQGKRFQLDLVED